MNSEKFQALLNTIEKEELSQFKAFNTHFEKMEFMYLSGSSDFKQIQDDREKCYYLTLAMLLYRMRFSEFDHLFNYSDKLGISIEVKKIPFRFKIITYLHIDGIQKDLTGRIFEIIRFFNKYNLFEKDFTEQESEIIEEIKESDKALICNLEDLFEKISDSLIFYSCKLMPYNLYSMYVERAKSYLPNKNRSQFRGRFNTNFLKQWTDWYSMYGLIVRNLGPVDQFIEMFEKNYSYFKKYGKKDETPNLIEFNAIYRTYYDVEDREYREIKKHIVSPENILKNKENILKKDNYNFYSLSMVLLGGLGPEGFGFTYSTPRGEVIEICLDQKKTEAGPIIQFKHYLTRKFLNNLEVELKDLDVERDLRKKIVEFVTKVLNPKNLENQSIKDSVIGIINDFLYKIEELQQQNNFRLEDLVDKISRAVSIIISDTTQKDQFVTRMDLVVKGKLKSEEIAKLTKINGKSHYDILRERFFLQNEINWFFKDYSDEIKALEQL